MSPPSIYVINKSEFNMELNLTKSFIIAIKVIWSPYFGFWDTLTEEFMISSQDTVIFLLEKPLLTTVLSSILILILLSIVLISFAVNIVTICLVIISIIIEGGFILIGSILLGLIITLIFILLIIVAGIKSKIYYNVNIRSSDRHKQT